jgi:hypothetical protein
MPRFPKHQLVLWVGYFIHVVAVALITFLATRGEWENFRAALVIYVVWTVLLMLVPMGLARDAYVAWRQHKPRLRLILNTLFLLVLGLFFWPKFLGETIQNKTESS